MGTPLSFRAPKWTHEVLDDDLEQGTRRLVFEGNLEHRYDLQDYQGKPLSQLPATFNLHARPESVPRESAIGGFKVVDGDIYTDVMVDVAVFDSIRRSLTDPALHFQGFSITVKGLPDEETGKTSISFVGNNPIESFKAVFSPQEKAPPPLSSPAPAIAQTDYGPIIARLNFLLAIGVAILVATLA
ncbi:hypothetical protein [Stenotrophomonas sp. C1657]|uniref:hypothetical protein n=1 Tax=Stenotrophomonas sp. C1657 TaxID=3077844 RepID=UPI00293C48CA|nr:hypothetical protein [Stenotrophomonas sp. C1657]MDV3515205.1 hypothetical protein [Stenotrophomonas sp. C1657]